ncbi:Cst complex subunit stn1 [Thalictrum thalictroides]|uniref:CST complex subunit STN1 n=1 Tax=Thalictrum thalictroides TaxID=46969 RepID=A0A7J6WCU9_THATH|nr:Cst complex subunit stn1 [Thalictrum thalictroides]
MQNTRVKLLASDFLTLTPKLSSYSSSSDPTLFFRKGKQVSRIETLGVVVSRERKGDRYLKFFIDDGTGCISCILWLNHLNSTYFARRNPSDVRLIADMAQDYATSIQLGVLARVRGCVTCFRGVLQITVDDVFLERDPNAEILHWLDCVKLARKFYDVPTVRPPLCRPAQYFNNNNSNKRTFENLR